MAKIEVKLAPSEGFREFEVPAVPSVRRLVLPEIRVATIGECDGRPRGVVYVWGRPVLGCILVGKQP